MMKFENFWNTLLKRKSIQSVEIRKLNCAEIQHQIEKSWNWKKIWYTISKRKSTNRNSKPKKCWISTSKRISTNRHSKTKSVEIHHQKENLYSILKLWTKTFWNLRPKKLPKLKSFDVQH